ncbi:MAG: NAD-dependent epimerase [Planctomycetota bacterium]|nr:MAG: NAD-dependent epimerase [Planctomycetota bacterium]
MHYLVTGAAGFIGSFTCQRLLSAGHQVTGIDNLNDYYDPQLKHARLEKLLNYEGFRFQQQTLEDRVGMANLFAGGGFQRVVHLAAQAGVRYSIEHPFAYVDANLNGFMTILEGCRHHGIEHLIYASSSSVYGMNSQMPFSVQDSVDHPVSLYAATKKANELMAHTYSHLYQVPTTGLRFFTVYGPWGRPDMAYFSFTKAILEGRPITVFNRGKLRRDFTYIDDIVEGVIRLCDCIPEGDPAFNRSAPDPSRSSGPYRVYNIGNSQPVELDRFIRAIETATGITAQREYLPMQPGDVEATAAEVSDLEAVVGFRPKTSIEDGIARFVQWYREYYRIPAK